MVKPRHGHVFDVPRHVDDLALLQHVLGLHLHGQVALDDPPACQLGGIYERIIVEVLHKISHLVKVMVNKRLKVLLIMSSQGIKVQKYLVYQNHGQ